MAKAEKKQTDNFDVVLTLSKEEAEYLRYLTGCCVHCDSVEHNGSIYAALGTVVDTPLNYTRLNDGGTVRVAQL